MIKGEEELRCNVCDVLIGYIYFPPGEYGDHEVYCLKHKIFLYERVDK